MVRIFLHVCQFFYFFVFLVEFCSIIKNGKKGGKTRMLITNQSNGINNKRKRLKKMIAIIAGITCITIAAAFFYVYSALQPLDNSSEEVEVVIPMGSSINSIASILEENGIIRNSTIFSYYTRLTDNGGFQAGVYQLSSSMSGGEIIEKLNSGPTAAYRVTIPEGRQMVQIAEIVEETFGIEAGEFLAKVNNEDYLRELQEKFPDILTDEIFQEDLRFALEGYLFPATYHFYHTDVTIEEIIEQMLQKTADILGPRTAEREAMGLTVHELLTMSSIIEAEATGLTDRKKIASVFYNRLEIDMPLQTDPTVLYAKGMHKARVLYAYLTVDSPFNTYIHRGLPIGPIGNAGVDSITAALEPEDTDYLFFLADRHGNVFYSKTYDEHNVLKAEHITARWAEEAAAEESED